MNIHRPFVRVPDPLADMEQARILVDRHPYSATCNCDRCFDAWRAMPPPCAEEQERQARAFSAAVAPSGRGELVTDWPRFSFPDLDRMSDDELKLASKQQRAFVKGRGL